MKIIHLNKHAGYNYELLDRFEAGIMLTGSEVKSVRHGGLNLKNSYVRINEGSAFLVSANISRYSGDDDIKYDPGRDRKLLLHKKEISTIAQKMNEQGLTAVPVKAYFLRGNVKAEIALAR